MNDLEVMLSNRKQELEKIINDANQYTRNVPKGKIRISRKGNKNQYYLRSQNDIDNHRGGKYIRRKDNHIAHKIIQNEYCLKVILAAQNELKKLVVYANEIKKNDLANIYEKTNNYRKESIIPIFLPDEVFIENWNNTQYSAKPFAEKSVEIYTNKGERVRSKSEKIIADYLSNKGIPYKYEKPLEIKNKRGKKITIYPDFTLLDVRNRREIYLEHFGLLDDPDYLENALLKVEEFELNNILLGDRLLITYETKKNPLNTRILERKMKSIL